MSLELEEKGAGVGVEVDLAIRREDQIIEELRIEKARIRLSGLRAIARLLCPRGSRDFLPTLKHISKSSEI